jgi:hypothetical protein
MFMKSRLVNHVYVLHNESGQGFVEIIRAAGTYVTLQLPTNGEGNSCKDISTYICIKLQSQTLPGLRFLHRGLNIE